MVVKIFKDRTGPDLSAKGVLPVLSLCIPTLSTFLWVSVFRYFSQTWTLSGSIVVSRSVSFHLSLHLCLPVLFF